MIGVRIGLMTAVLALGACVMPFEKSKAPLSDPYANRPVAAPKNRTTAARPPNTRIVPAAKGFAEIGPVVFFDEDQTTLSDQARARLGEQASWLVKNPDWHATIQGHADEHGTREYNLALGARRARSVQEYLILRGVPANRLGIVSFGKERPAQPCTTEICRLDNRRSVTAIAPAVGV